MPAGSITKYNSRTWRHVSVKDAITTADIKYAFLTNIAATHKTVLGQVDLQNPAAPAAGVVAGSHFPKPRRAAKRLTDEYKSSFVGTDALTTARTAGWAISKTRRAPKLSPNATGGTSFVVLVKVKVAAGGTNVSYGWRMPVTTFDRISQATLTSLGVDIVTEADLKDLVMTPNYPIPPRAAAAVAATGEEGATNNVSTYYDSSKALPAGWYQISGARTSL